MATDTEYADPFAERIAAQRALLAQVPQARFTPEQIAFREAENKRMELLGMLGMLSGNESLGGVGGAVAKRAQADRTPHTTERGTYDPLRGEFVLNPEMQREQQRADLARLEDRSAEGRRQDQLARVAARERAEEAERQRRFHVTENAANRAARGSNEPLVQVFDPETGQVHYVARSQAAGQQAPPKASGSANEGERNAAGFAQRMTEATKLLDAHEDKGKATATTQAAGAVPWVGGFAQRGVMTAPQQQYDQASQDWIRAKLRKESGAVIGPQEMAQEYATYFPMPNDGPEVIAQKKQARAIATQAMVTAAGRGMQPDAPRANALPNAVRRGQQGADSADPLGLRQ